MERLHVDATIIRSFTKSNFHVSYHRCMPGTFGRQQSSFRDSLFFMLKISFLPKYRVKYYDYIVKWCSGVACNWCVLLDIGSILALTKAELQSKRPTGTHTGTTSSLFISLHRSSVSPLEASHGSSTVTMAALTRPDRWVRTVLR